MPNNNNRQAGINRRRFIEAAGVGGMLALAGCSSGGDSGGGDSGGGDSGGDDSGDSGGQQFNPSVVENMVPVSPGDLRSQVPRMWMDYASDHYGAQTSITNNPGAASLVNMNDTWNAEPNGEVLGTFRAVPTALYQVGRDEAEFNVSDFNFVLRYLSDTRAVQINPRTTPIEEHWQWTWDDTVEYVREEGLTFGIAGGHHEMYASLLWNNEPRFEDTPKENWEYIYFDSGSNARAAIQRGDIDGYFGGYNSNITARTDFYKTQGPVCNGPDLFPDIAERQQTIIRPQDNPDSTLPDSHFLTNTSFPQDAAEDAVNIILDGIVATLPPETPDHVYEAHNEALKATTEEDGLEEDIAKAFSAYAFAPAHGEDVQTFLENKTQLIEENFSEFVSNLF